MRSAGSRLVALAVLCAVVAFILWKSGDRSKAPVFQSDATVPATATPEPAPAMRPEPTPPPVVVPAAPPAPTPPPAAPVQSMVPATPVAPRIAARMARAATMPAPALPAGPAPIDDAVQGDMNNVQTAFRDYAFAFDGNPWGTNAEITKALLGGNDKGIRFPIPEGSTVNSNGEMCDRWGTPYFFHQLSKKKMEIRSAGPDREMWTNDDLQR